jgi:hypothetical protein
VYDKALRRKDASGVITKAEPETETKSGKKADGKEEKKTNADSGKVVNLMAGMSLFQVTTELITKAIPTGWQILSRARIISTVLPSRSLSPPRSYTSESCRGLRWDSC